MPVNHTTSGAKASRQKVNAAPAMADQSRALARAMASPPATCMLLRVTAVAMPEGKGSCSILISCRFKGTAMKTPSTEMAASQDIISHHSSVRPVAI